MARKNINIFSSDDIESTRKMLDELSNYLSSNQMIEELTNMAYGEVIKNVSEYSKNHLGTINTEVAGNVGRVYTNDSVLIYNEYGTGVVGSQNPHPETDGWQYDINSHGDIGWWYQDNGEWHWTKGLPARQGFYDAREKMKQIVGDKINLTIEKIFNYEK